METHPPFLPSSLPPSFLGTNVPDGITAGIVVANHQYEGDWWFMLIQISHPLSLPPLLRHA